MPIREDEFSYTLDLTDELEGVPRRTRSQAKKAVIDVALSEIKRTTAKQESSVTGDRFAPLSEDYLKIKKKKGKGKKANLVLNNDMLPAIKGKPVRDGVKLEITKKKEILKAFNHNTGDLGPQRQFMPDEDLAETFTHRIEKKIDAAIEPFRIKPKIRREEPAPELEEELIRRLRPAVRPTPKIKIVSVETDIADTFFKKKI